jgi:serine/threonine protein kinase
MNPSQARTARPTRRAPPSRPASTPAPIILGRYRLHQRLGTGAFGTVWRARDERLEREVAVKILARERVVGGRFEREARAAARLHHPGIVTLYEAAVDDDGAYLVSELVRGSTLDALLVAGRLSDSDIVAIGITLCDALDHAHAQSVVHRDVKPSNVLIPDRPVTPAQMAKLTDFGVARVIGGDTLTMTGDVIGTLAYMAPEQAEGMPAGAPADLYSLALVLYEALTGVNPIRATTAAQRARRLGAYLPPLRRQRRDLPRELGQGIDQALRPNPRERGRVLDLRRALVAAREHVSDEPGVVSEPWTLRPRTGIPVPPDPEFEALAVAPTDEPQHPQRTPEEPQAPAQPIPWGARGLAALGAAAVAAWLSVHALGSAPVPPALAALVAGGLTLVLPRLSWPLITVASCGLAAAQGHTGLALLALIALALPVLLMLRSPTAWPLAAGAPALGLFGLAGAWPAVAARAASPWRRAALAGTGWLWLLIAAPVADRVLYLPRLPGTLAPAYWSGSLDGTLHHVVTPILQSGALAAAVVWGVAALVLPYLVLERSPVLDFVRVVVWVAVLLSATGLAVAAVHGSDALPAAPSAIVGGLAAMAVALAPSWWRAARAGWRPQRHPAGTGGHFS